MRRLACFSSFFNNASTTLFSLPFCTQLRKNTPINLVFTSAKKVCQSFAKEGTLNFASQSWSWRLFPRDLVSIAFAHNTWVVHAPWSSQQNTRHLSVALVIIVLELELIGYLNENVTCNLLLGFPILHPRHLVFGMLFIVLSMLRLHGLPSLITRSLTLGIRTVLVILHSLISALTGHHPSSFLHWWYNHH